MLQATATATTTREAPNRFVVGGLVPLLPQTSLPLYLRLASLWEIFGQNFLTGVACACLFVDAGRAQYGHRFRGG
jgi:hypothetical protein